MTLIALLPLALSLGLQAAGPWPESVPRIAEATVKAAIQAYAPILVGQQGERYQPTSVESYLAITEPFGYLDEERQQFLTGLRHRPADPERQGQARGGDPERAKAYVNVKVGAQTTELQYWFLYAYNGPSTAYLKRLAWDLRYEAVGDYPLEALGSHEGDWEHLSVTIDNRTGQAAPLLYLAAHGGGQYCELARCLIWMNQVPRLVVNASNNGHALYPDQVRSYSRTLKAGLLELRLLDDCSAPGAALDFQQRTEVIGLQGDPALKAGWDGKGFQEPSYVSAFAGRWGRVRIRPQPLLDLVLVGNLLAWGLKALGLYEEVTLEAGPYPPWSKGSWLGTE